MSTTTINERTSHPILLRLLYWLVAIAVVAMGVTLVTKFTDLDQSFFDFRTPGNTGINS